MSPEPNDWLKFAARANIHHYRCPHTINLILKNAASFVKHIELLCVDLQITNASEHTNTYFETIVEAPNKNGTHLLRKTAISDFFGHYIKPSKITVELIDCINSTINRISMAVACHIVSNGLNNIKFGVDQMLGFANQHKNITNYRMVGNKPLVSDFKSTSLKEFFKLIPFYVYKMCLDNNLNSNSFSISSNGDIFEIYLNFVSMTIETAIAPLFISYEMNEMKKNDNLVNDLIEAVTTFMDTEFKNVHNQHDDGDFVYDGDHSTEDFINKQRDLIDSDDDDDDDMESDELSEDENELENLKKESKEVYISKIKLSKIKGVSEKSKGIKKVAKNNFDDLKNYFTLIPSKTQKCRYNCSLCNENKVVRMFTKLRNSVYIKACSECLNSLHKSDQYTYYQYHALSI